MSPYGQVVYYRHVYQSSIGGSTYVPADERARLITKTTPRLAKIIGYHYAQNSSKEVIESMKLSHDLDLNVSYVQDISNSLAAICEEKQDKWTYSIPDSIVSQTIHIAFSRDGTTTRIKSAGYRETMCGSLSCYDAKGERIYGVYVGNSPESKKYRFNAQLSYEISQMKAIFPHATYIGIADGAVDGWTYLDAQTDVQILDFFHAAGYLSDFSKAYFEENSQAIQWFEKHKKILKEQNHGVKKNIKKMKAMLQKMPTGILKIACQKSITYFENNQHRMDYESYLRKGYPIGSGVIEAACKTLIKQRLSRSGMIWTTEGVNKVLAIRQIVLSEDRWKQFWQKIQRYGF